MRLGAGGARGSTVVWVARSIRPKVVAEDRRFGKGWAMAHRRRLIPLAQLAAASLALAACGGDDDTSTTASSTTTTESTTSGATGAAGAEGGQIETVASSLEDGGYTIDDLPPKGNPKPVSARIVSGGEIAQGAFVYLEEFASEADATEAADSYKTSGIFYKQDGTIILWGNAPADQATVDAAASAAGL